MPIYRVANEEKVTKVPTSRAYGLIIHEKKHLETTCEKLTRRKYT